MVDGIGRRQTPTHLRLVSPNSGATVQSVFAKLKTIFTNPSWSGMQVASLILEVLPGYDVRFDHLTYKDEKAFARTDFAHAFSGEKTDVTLLIQSLPGRVKVEGDPEFIASMQAMNTRQEVLLVDEGKTCLAVPLLDKGNKVLGAIVLFTEPKDKPSYISPEDKIIFREYAQYVASFLS
ncbi:MAG: hypothetical protein ABIH50_08020 [bacterium]